MLKNKQNFSDDEESRLDETDGGWSVEEDTGQEQQNDETNYDEYNDYEQDSEEIEDEEDDDYGGKRRDKKRHKGNKNDPNFIDNREIETELSTYHRDNRRAVAEIERSVFEEDNFDAEKVAQAFNERYRRTASRLSDDEEDLTKPEIATVDKLFAVKCRKGHVFHAIDRLENLKKLRSDPLKIKRVIAIEGIEDFVYIEADKEQDVQNAAMRCNKYLYSSKKNIKRLSPKEKQDLMAPKKPRLNIQIGSFVRTNKRDEYFGDLARVTSYSTDEVIEVEIIPRILVDQDGASLKRKHEIKVLQGSLKGSVGTVISVKDGVLTVTDKENGGRIFKVNSEECVKNINVHDYVQITNGPYQGQSGFVFNCDRHVMTMYLDHTNKQISVFAKDLKKGVQNSIVNDFGGFRYFDLVQLKDSSVGIIIDIRKAQKNYEYDVLNSENNLVKSVTASGITRSLHDIKSQTFKKGDQVVTSKMEGINKQLYEVFRIYEAYVFVRTYDDDTNLGFSCFKTKDLKLKYESSKRVQASQGALKGYQGTVKGVYGNMADVEFDAKLTTVKVELEQLFHVNEKGEALDPVIPRNRESSRGSMDISPGLGSYPEPSWTTGLSKQQKSWGYSLGSAMTPNPHLLDGANSGLSMDGSKTPALHSSGLLSGSKTPALRNSSANHSNNNHTSLGSKTPAWDLGSKTPAYGLMSDGSKTPAWDSGSHTPHSSGIVGGNSGNNSVSNISNIFGGSNSNSATTTTNATLNISSVAAETPGYSGITNTPGYSAVATPAADTPNYPVYTPANTGSLIPPTPRPFTPGNLPMTPANMIPQTPFATQLSANHAVHHGRDPKKPPDVK
ncbi:13202_t:CDS:10, partial [Funneliformis geosporum]